MPKKIAQIRPAAENADERCSTCSHWHQPKSEGWAKMFAGMGLCVLRGYHACATCPVDVCELHQTKGDNRDERRE